MTGSGARKIAGLSGGIVDADSSKVVALDKSQGKPRCWRSERDVDGRLIIARLANKSQPCRVQIPASIPKIFPPGRIGMGSANGRWPLN